MSLQRPDVALDRGDLNAFAKDVRALRDELRASLGPEDLEHLERMERWGRAATAVGLLTAWLGPNPVSIAGLALGRGARWMLMHHIAHRGYDAVPGVKPRYTSAVFAKGWRRWLDWPDWIYPYAWIYEHNVLHHSYTGEDTDPDQFERNTEWINSLPAPVRYGLLAALTATWRQSYYAKNTMEEWMRRGGRTPTSAQIYKQVALRCWLPYAAYHLALLPALYAPLGPLAVTSAAINSAVADVVTNVHTFLVVGPNHAGEDLWRFDDRAANKAEYYARQAWGSTNYATGSDVVDFAHLWLNYQIEHHLFPDMPMLKYQQMQPRVKELCERYGLPYVQESVFTRFRKMADIFTGKAVMKRA